MASWQFFRFGDVLDNDGKLGGISDSLCWSVRDYLHCDVLQESRPLFRNDEEEGVGR